MSHWVIALWLAFMVAWVMVRRQKVQQKLKAARHATRPCSTLIILGSGGHTAEMLRLVENLAHDRYQPRAYVVAASDTLSEQQARKAEQVAGPWSVHKITRARNVGQSWWTVPLSASLGLLDAAWVLWKTRPELILCNGPGSCVPVCVLAWLLQVGSVWPVRVVYVESLARVKTLSLSGKLLYPIVDLFIVQWPSLTEQYPKALCMGHLV